MTKRTLRPERIPHVLLMGTVLVVAALLIKGMSALVLMIIWWIFYWNICEEV